MMILLLVVLLILSTILILISILVSPGPAAGWRPPVPSQTLAGSPQRAEPRCGGSVCQRGPGPGLCQNLGPKRASANPKPV